MQKKLIVLALASAFAAPAFAATSNVDIYGQFDVSVDYASGMRNSVSGIGTANSNHAWRLSSNVSRIGLKGSEDLGGGLAAIWQFEQGVNLDGGATSSGWGNQRNTFLGLKSNFGTLLAGTHDTPYKLSTSSLDPFADSAGDYNAIIGSFLGLNTSDLRLGNVLAYISPNFSGLTAAVATSFLREQGQTNVDGKPSAWTGMVNYANGPLYLAGGYEIAKHVDPNFAGANDVDIRSWKLGAGYTLGNFTVNAIYDNIKVSDNIGNVFGTTTDKKRSAWGLNGVYNMGNIALKAGYYHAGKVTDLSDSAANMYEVGADYNLSKRTKLYAVYSKVQNDNNATYCAGGSASAGFGSSGISATACPGVNVVGPNANPTGKDPSIFAVGMRHTF
ncbi:MAG TPA: porin [Thiobacillaceae bacterium]|nr:porin [Thiobacillaceae bacterium]